MRGNATGFTVEVLTRAMLEEFPELDHDRVRAAIERGHARVANAALDTAGQQVVDQQLALAEATEEATERAKILRELAETLAERGDAERSLVVRLAAFAEAPARADLDPLLHLGRVTKRWGELPLEQMCTLIDISDDASPRRLDEIAAAFQQLGNLYRAADCYERALLLSPGDTTAHEALEVFYRTKGEWPTLIELLNRRALHIDNPSERADLFREIAVVYERELGDDIGALDAYREADNLRNDSADTVDAIARLSARVGFPDEETLATLERLALLLTEPKRRAMAYFRAADIAKHHDYDKAQHLFEKARADDPDLVTAIDGLATLLRDRGNLSAVIALLVESAERPALVAERARWLIDAADFCVAIGDTDWAKSLYREARAADPTSAKAGLALVELCWDTGSLVELAPILDELCKAEQEPGRLRGYLLQRSKVALELGDKDGARAALARAVELDPHDPQTRRELADLLFEHQEWAKARELIEGLLEDHEDLLQPETSIELHYRVARCAHELGDTEGAEKHAAVTLALAPDHRGALLLRAEHTKDPAALLADQLALANIAPPEEKGVRFSALGDRYAELGDRATAREMYREALASRPNDHLLLTKFLGLVADEGDWSYSLDLVHRLIDTEQDRKVRGRYRHLAAMISRDELARPDDAIALFEQAVEDDPLLFSAADELEAQLASDLDALVRFLYRRLEHVRNDEGRSGERLRLWDKLGELCLQLDRREDAITAFEVALTLDPDNLVRRQRLADLYLDADPKHAANAIVQHQTVLRANKRRIASYEALRSLYRRTNQLEKARACDDALSIIGVHVVEEKVNELFKRQATGELPIVSLPGATKPLTNEDWLALARIDVDLQLSALFALMAPAFAADRARVRPPAAFPAKEALERDLPAPIARAISRVVTAFGIVRPAVLADPSHTAPCTLQLRLSPTGTLTPLLVIGRPALDNVVEDKELAFLLARQLADLRSERIARLLCPRATDLSQIIEVATGAETASSHSGKLVATTLGASERDQAFAIGGRLRERNLDAARAALSWLLSSERAADRIGLVVVGDLATCIRMIEREPAASQNDMNRVLDLIWSSVTEEVLGVRSRVENWPEPSARPKRAQTAPVPIVPSS